MPMYKYKAVTKTGNIVRNNIEEVSKQNIVKVLKEHGLTPISIEKVQSIALTKKKKQKRNVAVKGSVTLKQVDMKNKAKKKKAKSQDVFAGLKGVTKEDIIAFTQSLYLLKRANFTNLRALTTLLENTEGQAMREIVEDILNGVEAGEYIYSTLEYYSQYFPFIYINMIKVGELSGSLTDSLAQALNYLKESNKLTKQVKKILMPSLMQTGGLLLMMLAGIIFGLPMLEDLYASMGVTDQIPAATLALGHFVELMGQYWYITVSVIAAGIYLFRMWYSTPEGRYRFDNFKINMPVFGKLLLLLQLQKFFQAMQMNLQNNARLQDALEVSKSVTSNYVLLSALEAAQNNLQIGESWIEPFEKLEFFPTMILEMLRIGMETDMHEMIDKIVEFVEDDIQIALDRIIKVLPEVTMSITGVILIAFMLFILTPIIQVYMGGFLFDAYGM